ncbi:hypothetical protein [Fictibacillus phosphorivorans]|uniref:hypothetical protein n=1 Tax=Fictibacillus phosphorivorans TaxID=1221500 RepID=UPI00203D31C1|nr:hypothetical protein [Fictibacillus phosphorivorans]MCM3718956.1 hypothetical protein [Fictibacillus phosphorivorans]MCM3776578.1 hypothetical protein [Fictibacillus phosphorivorans]
MTHRSRFGSQKLLLTHIPFMKTHRAAGSTHRPDVTTHRTSYRQFHHKQNGWRFRRGVSQASLLVRIPTALDRKGTFP